MGFKYTCSYRFGLSDRFLLFQAVSECTGWFRDPAIQRPSLS